MISLPFTTYSLYIAEDLFESDLWQILGLPLQKRLVIITDSNLMQTYGRKVQAILHARGLSTELLAFPAGEEHKTRQTKEQLEDELLSRQFGRDTCFLALGGGLVTDLVGFLAATYCRGVPVIYLPTTLLAMIDASMGGKTGVNTPIGKNLIGTFTQPYAVCMDVSTLRTLPDSEWRNGVAEMIKHALIADVGLFQQMQRTANLSEFQQRKDLLDLIRQNCAIKKSIVVQDEHEQHMRQLLNFGHTIGHAIEALEQYQIGHGEAVAIGMLVECYLAMRAGHLAEAVLTQVYDLLEQYGLPLQTQAFLNRGLFLETLTLDKKSLQMIPRFVLLRDIGHPHIQEGSYTHAVDPNHLQDALDWAAVQFSGGG